MPSYISLSQHLPMFLTIASILFLIIIFSMNVRTKLSRSRSKNENARDFIDNVRADALDKSKSKHISKSYSTQQSGADLIEYEQTIRQLNQQLDTKNAILEMLIRQADQRIAMINDLLDKLPGASISPTKIQAASEDNYMPDNSDLSDIFDKDNETEECQDEIYTDHNYNDYITEETDTTIPPEIMITPIANDSSSSTTAQDPDYIPMSIHLDPLTANVYELADRGRSNIEIAQNLDEQVGKVELILALRDKSSITTTNNK